MYIYITRCRVESSSITHRLSEFFVFLERLLDRLYYQLTSGLFRDADSVFYAHWIGWLIAYHD